MSKIKGYKGFDNNLRCRGYQYEVGKTFECDGKIECCENGFHFCENPFDVFGYYPPSDSRYCSVEGEGETSKDNGDSKVAVSRLHVSAEIGLKGLINAGVKFILDRVKWEEDKSTNTGNRSAATNTGYQSAGSHQHGRLLSSHQHGRLLSSHQHGQPVSSHQHGRLLSSQRGRKGFCGDSNRF